ncbi:MAG TPA: hypothetical protein VGX02_10540 [Candidatus Eremiobacteraceae bacterium]|jgi:hypothetical protein|nr:hypothetical protein [Candidatus Eremiobacteraceae bacterium]
MRKFSYGLLAVAVIAASTAIALAGPNPPMSENGPKTGTAFKFNPMNKSAQQGTVTMVAAGSKTRVTIALTGEPMGAIEPAHVHVGNCAHPGAVIYPLTDVVAGHSVTLVNAPLSKVQVTGNSVNVHKSAAQLNLYMACANLTSP